MKKQFKMIILATAVCITACYAMTDIPPSKEKTTIQADGIALQKSSEDLSNIEIVGNWTVEIMVADMELIHFVAEELADLDRQYIIYPTLRVSQKPDIILIDNFHDYAQLLTAKIQADTILENGYWEDNKPSYFEPIYFTKLNINKPRKAFNAIDNYLNRSYRC